MRLNDLQLPTEVVSIVLGQSLNVGPDNKSESVLKEARRALFKLRLVCRSWNYIAIRHLFETIQLQYHHKPLQDEDEFGPWSKILGNESFRNTIHRVVINSTPEDPEMYDSEWSWDEGTGEYPRLTRVIDAIVDLPNLRAVQLSFSDKCFEPWGSLSGHFDGKGLRFPNLKTLNLISFAIFRYDYLDWVLEQTSLETLRLGACCILSHAMVTEEGLAGLKVSTKDWIQLPSGAYGTEGPKIAYHFPGTWETEFDRIRTTLTNLMEFRLSGPDRRSFDGPYDHFDNPENIKNDLANGRYVQFLSGACSSPCIIPGDGFGDENPVPTNERGEDDEWGECTYHEVMLEGDSRARDELLETVKKRRSLKGT
ncbi:hypothetical protein C8035_v007023 [Colletotrichum spinosum]|uniref:F-box domain-containing protein n=1 Tax=Colletotrichum spinosum TaxID=1347390 RepID=A0A4R8QNU6_9PEZI|nr:hypothetical protein C8035_v007023 [Colletotrichum spinosum]